MHFSGPYDPRSPAVQLWLQNRRELGLPDPRATRRPIFQWIDDEPRGGRLGDAAACEALKAQLTERQNQLAQLNALKGQLAQAAIDASMADASQALASINAQIVAVDGSRYNVQSDIAQLNAQIADCEKLVEPVDPPPYVPPPYVPPSTGPVPPPPTKANKPESRSWLLLAAGATLATAWALVS